MQRIETVSPCIDIIQSSNIWSSTRFNIRASNVYRDRINLVMIIVIMGFTEILLYLELHVSVFIPLQIHY